MSKEQKSLVFFGSGPVAAASLELLARDFILEAVVTKHTTKQEMITVAKDTPVYSVSDKKDLNALFTTKKFNSQIGILIDFGIIVSKKIIDYFPKGIVNSHFSLLPELRGADPITFAILEGKEKTGVSLMLLVEAMDEGPILTIGEQPLNQTETGPELTAVLIELSHSLLKSTIPAYIDEVVNPASGVIPKPQSQETVCNLLNKDFNPTYTRKITKADGVIDWNKSAAQIEKEIRAYAGWPKSRTTLGRVDVVITKAHDIPSNTPGLKPGDIQIDAETNLLTVEAASGHLSIDRLKPAGKNEMDVKSFINGYQSRVLASKLD